MNKKTQGFTLPEILVVMVIVALLSQGSFYGFQQWQKHQRLWQTAYQLSQFIHQLRNDANIYNCNHILASVGHSDQWQINSLPSEPCKKSWQFIPPFNEVSLTEMTEGLGFYGVMNTARPGHILISSPAGKRKIIISVWGRIRVVAVKERE